MVRIFGKGIPIPLGSFLSTDFDCHCEKVECDKTLIDEVLISGLEELSDILGKPKITSGFRCASHNREVGGVPDSQHIKGKASDVESENATPVAVGKAASRISVFSDGGIGVYLKFTHLDVRGHMARWGLEISC